MGTPASVLEKELVVVTGKGGVGKSTVAAALGMAAAARGMRTIIAEVAARDDVTRALAGEREAAPFTERELGPRLHHISIEPELAMEEYLVDQLPVRALADVLAASRIFTYLTAATPGLRELLTIGKVWELAQPGRRTPGGDPYDLVVLDAPATGHGVAILTAPRTFADAARVGPVARQGGIIHSMLNDPGRTGVVAVSTAEEMPVNETLALRDALREQMGLDLALVVVNGLLPDRFSAQEAELLQSARAGPAGSSAVRMAVSAHRRARAQAEELDRLRTGLDGIPIATLPLLFTPALDADGVGRLAQELGKAL